MIKLSEYWNQLNSVFNKSVTTTNTKKQLPGKTCFIEKTSQKLEEWILFTYCFGRGISNNGEEKTLYNKLTQENKTIDADNNGIITNYELSQIKKLSIEKVIAFNNKIIKNKTDDNKAEQYIKIIKEASSYYEKENAFVLLRKLPSWEKHVPQLLKGYYGGYALNRVIMNHVVLNDTLLNDVLNDENIPRDAREYGLSKKRHIERHS